MSHAKKLFTNGIATTTNKEGFVAYNRSIEEEYLQLLLTNTFSNTFYANSQELLAQAQSIHQGMVELNPEFMAKALVYARNEGFMRLQPLYGLAVLSGMQPQLFAAVFPRVVRIPSDLADFLTILRGMRRGQGGRAVKRQVARFLGQTSEYWALKYNGRGRGFSLGDAIATAHPKPANLKQQALYRYLRGQETNLALLPQIEALDKLKKATDDNERIRLIQEGKLPYEAVTSTISPTRGIWQTLMKQMPAFALLRHLNTLDRHGVFSRKKNLKYVQERLTDVEALRKARILPFRFAKAFAEVNHPELRDTLREAVDLSFDNLPDLPGRTAIFLDISGSMTGEYLQTGSIFALALYKKTDGSSLFWLFDTLVEDAKPSRRDSIMSQAERIHARGGTDTGAPVRRLIETGEKVDQIIMITDEQQNAGSPFYRELLEYRRQINPHAKAFIVDIAPYQSAMVPPEDSRTFYIYGWSDTVLSFIAQSVQGYEGMARHVESLELEDAGSRDSEA